MKKPAIITVENLLMPLSHYWGYFNLCTGTSHSVQRLNLFYHVFGRVTVNSTEHNFVIFVATVLTILKDGKHGTSSCKVGYCMKP